MKTKKGVTPSHINNLKAQMGTIYHPLPFEANYIPHILKEMYIDGVYNPYFQGRENLTILDLGANIGLFSQYARRYAKKIYAVEPAQENYDCLVKNIESNGWDNVTPVKVAVAKEDGELILYHSPNKTAHTLINGNPQFSEKVEAVSLESLFNRFSIKSVDLCKLDIEGAEFEVLGGLSFKKIAPKISIIIGEMHSWAGINYSQIMWSLNDAGFNFKMLDVTEASVFMAWRDK